MAMTAAPSGHHLPDQLRQLLPSLVPLLSGFMIKCNCKLQPDFSGQLLSAAAAAAPAVVVVPVMVV